MSKNQGVHTPLDVFLKMGPTKIKKGKSRTNRPTMEKRKTPIRSCESKLPYADRKAAEEATIRLMKKGKLSGSHKVYKCSYCTGFHIGKS